MQNKLVIKIEVLILIILFTLFILSVFYAYIALIKSDNKISPSAPITPDKKIFPTKQPPKLLKQEPTLTCSQIDRASFDSASKKYIVTLGSNSSDSTWSILNILNCSPTAGSGSIFTTTCIQLGTSTATVSFGGDQNTCDFSTEP